MLKTLLTCPNNVMRNKDLLNLVTMLRSNLSNRFSFIVALAIFRKYQDKEDRLKGIRLVHSFVMRSFILERNQVNTFMRKASSLAVKIRNEQDLHFHGAGNVNGFTNLDELANEIEKDFPISRMKENLKDYVPANSRLGFYVAYMFEVAASTLEEANTFGGAHPDLQSEKQHLEHIMPQSVATAPQWNSLHIAPELAKSIYSRWGNLLVLPSKVNSSIKNKSIDDKITVYCGSRCSAFLLPKNVRDYLTFSVDSQGHGVWDLEAIRKRETSLIKLLSAIAWPTKIS